MLLPLQGSDPSAVVIEYRGPSNEFAAPIVLTARGLTCAKARQMLTARNVTLAPSQCPIEVRTLELAALGRSLGAMRSDSTGLYREHELLRATVFDGDSSAFEVSISREQAPRVFDVVAQHIPEERYPALTTRLADLRQRLPASAMVSLSPLKCGVPTTVDDAVQSRIIYHLTSQSPSWSVRTITSSNTSGDRLLELTNEAKRVWVGISYLASSEDAAGQLDCRLKTIPAPRFRAVPGVGGEAYVLTQSVLLFRFGTFVFHVQSFDQSLDAEKAIAMRLITSVQRP